MAKQYGITLANALLDAWETNIGASPILRIYTGAQPADCDAAASGTKLVEMTLPADFMAAASGGSKAMSGTWSDTSADDTGTAGYYRIYDSGDTTCKEQGSVTVTGGGGDLTLSTVSVTAGLPVSITTFTLSMSV